MKRGLLFLVVLSVFVGLSTAQEKTVEQKINAQIAEMTLEEKVAMCHAQSKFSSSGVGRLGIPDLWMSDGPHGVRAEINWDDWGHAGNVIKLSYIVLIISYL